MLCLVCAFLWLLIEFLFIDLALAFFDRDDALQGHPTDFVHRAVGPTYLDLINFRALLESDVQPQIALRQETIPAAHVNKVRQPPGRHGHARADAAAITLHA